MTDYTKTTDFASKDALSTGNPAKIVKGTEIDDELVAISGAVASKADKASPTFTGTPAAPTASSGTSTTQIATTAFATGAASLVMPSGAMLQWPTATAPSGFLLCTGAAVSRTIYAALFAVIGTTFGAGDGTTTFNLPDFDNRFPVGAGDLYTVAATGGSKDAVVVSHTHGSGNTGSTTITGSFNTAAQTPGSTGVFSTVTSYSGNGADPHPNYTINLSAPHTHTIASEGESGTNKNLPPYLSIYFIIKT
jgi:microcystin-dependent protein